MASALASGSAADRTEIAFFDVETSAPERRALLEFGAILVCQRTLVEVASFSSFVRPDDLDAVVPVNTTLYNGITHETIAGAPPFSDVADRIYDILHGRVWAGHNIMGFDAKIIWKAFADIGRPPPEPKGVIDTLYLLSQRFGRRAGDMKEASPPEVFPVTDLLEGAFPEVPNYLEDNPFSPKWQRTACLAENAITGCSIQGTTGEPDNVQMNSSSDYSRFLEPDNISTECIKVSVALLQRFGPRTIIQHKGVELQLRCTDLRVRFGVSAKFLSITTGRPKLSIEVNIPDNLSNVLEFCDYLAWKSSPEAVFGTSQWRPLVKKHGHMNRPTVRLNIPTVDAATYSTDICKKERNGTTQKLVFRKVDAAELDSLLRWSKVDAFFSLEVYDYQQNAGIRLVAKRLDVHSR